MKKLHLLLIGLLLAGLLALAGCSRYDSAREGARTGRSGNYVERSLEQGRRGQAEREPEGRGPNRGAAAAEPGYQSTGRGRLKELEDSGSERLGRKAQPGSTPPSGNYAPEQSGRAVVEKGTVRTLNGTLDSEAGEWYLLSAEERYALHFGNSRYVQSTGIALREGESIEVRGFLSEDGVAVIAARLGGALYAFRSEDGTPLWAGNGRGGGSGRGAGRGRDGSGQEERPGATGFNPLPFAPAAPGEEA